MKNIFRSALSSFAFIALFSIYAFVLTGNIIPVDKTGSWIQYTVNHTFHKATAVSNNFTCNIDFDPDARQVQKVAVSAAVGTFDSKNSNRDSNAMEAVEALKFSSVKFISSSVNSAGAKLSVKGNLTFHGITKEISFNAEQKTEGSKLTIQGSFKISLDEYKVERPSLLGMKIDDDVLVEFKTAFSISAPL
jgi:polyisoprenoid-binding protein YceI